MAAANIRSKEAYLRKMALDGYVVRLDLEDIRKMVFLLQNATNNLNQIAKRANETRSVFESDIQDLQANYERLWDSAETIMRSLANIRKLVRGGQCYVGCPLLFCLYIRCFLWYNNG